VETVRYLLENGAAVHTRDRYGHSALDDAILFGRHDVIKLLVAMGAHLVLPPPRIGLVMCKYVCTECSLRENRILYLIGIRSW
jgi:lysophospholipase